MKSEKLSLKLSFPVPSADDWPTRSAFWKDICLDAQQLVRTHFRYALERGHSQGLLKYFKETETFCSEHHPLLRKVCSCRIDELGLWDLANHSFVTLACISYRLALYKETAILLPNEEKLKAGEFPGFVQIENPWDVILRCAAMKELKTQTNFEFIAHVGVHCPVISKELLPIPSVCKHEFRDIRLDHYEWRLLWQCKHCGFLCHCSCFRRVIEQYPFVEHEITMYDLEKGRYLRTASFFDSACELCRGVIPTTQYCSPMYARSQFEVYYGPYIRKRMFEMRTDGIDVPYLPLFDAQASNHVRGQVGAPLIGEKWKNETTLFYTIKELFPDEEVIHHFRAKWLERYELDIFLPSRKLAIEYHGQQHFKPIEAWGGEESLAITQERDARKKEACHTNGVKLISFAFQDEITYEAVRNRLHQEGIVLTAVATGGSV